MAEIGPPREAEKPISKQGMNGDPPDSTPGQQDQSLFITDISDTAHHLLAPIRVFRPPSHS